ncbi:MAG: hypothetical protein RIF41_02765 [Polyangiaceae bacterium]
MTQNAKHANRRLFLGGSAALLLGACGGDSGNPVDDATGSGGADPGAGGGVGGAGGIGGLGGGTGGDDLPPIPRECTATADNLLGPYYRPGAPFRDDLTELGMAGTRITIRGRVLGPDCELLEGAVLDFWQADDDGGYDNDGVADPPPDVYVLRGKVAADGDGIYAIRSIVPGHYLNGAQYRPAHVHVTVSAEGYAPLTTQLYFDGDPYNEIDPFIIESLIMTPNTNASGELEAWFDFVLEPL